MVAKHSYASQGQVVALRSCEEHCRMWVEPTQAKVEPALTQPTQAKVEPALTQAARA